MKRWLVLAQLPLVVGWILRTQMPPPIEQSWREPVKYIGKRNPDPRFYDGKLPHAVGVHHVQVFRSNRSQPLGSDTVGWTYAHQPYLAYWKGQFYLQFIQGLVEEHNPPTRTLMLSSEDGYRWSNPIIVFPEYELPEIHDDEAIIPAGTKAVMHQRMGWYVAQNGRLLVSGFYGYAATPRRAPNTGNGLGRVVREVYEDGSLGPIYFVRYNRHAGWGEHNTRFPFYTASPDKGFIEACNLLLSNKLITLQWWEEDRAEDGFYPLNPSQVVEPDAPTGKVTTSAGAGKAFCFYRRPDGAIVGLWKNQYSSLSPDNGLTWRPIVKNKTLWTTGAKTWGQRTDDGRYVIVHNQSPTRRNRFPMAALVGEDGHLFDRIFALRGEVPPRRYQGLHKNPGVQYFRGIIEGNGNPPGDEMWITYSVNKEDIWISRTRVPITESVQSELAETFDSVASIKELSLWNLYIPAWAPITIVADRATGDRYLQLRDEEPYDYCYAERIFPKSSTKTIQFRFQGERLPQGYAVEIELQDQDGNRPLRLRIDKEWLSFDLGKVEAEPIKIAPARWHHVVLKIDCAAKQYRLQLDSKDYPEAIPFNEAADNVERIVFRTGPYRNHVPPEVAEAGAPKQSGFDCEDLPGSERKAPLIVFNLDDLRTSSR